MRTRAKKNVASNCVRRRIHRGTFILIGCFSRRERLEWTNHRNAARSCLGCHVKNGEKLAEIGVTVNIESCDTSTFFPRFFASKDKELATTWDLGTNGWDSQRGSNCGQAISYFTNRLCDCGYSDEVSGLAQKAIGTADAKEKQELWNTIQDKALEECWEYPLTYTNFVMVSQKNVTGLDGSSVVPEFIDYLSIHVD